MAEQKRVRRTSEQIASDLAVEIQELKSSIDKIEDKKNASIAEFDKKIAKVQEKINHLEERRKSMLTPKKRPRRRSKSDQIKSLVKQAQKNGMKLEEIADKLGVDIEVLN